jgi:periplasmic divalent cation tolerance protein
VAEIVEVTITYDASAPAEAAARSLIARRLAACVHVDGPIRSIFRWEGAVQTEDEWRLTAKTTPALAETVASTLRAEHPYDLPGLVMHSCKTPDDFAQWVAEETTGATPD